MGVDPYLLERLACPRHRTPLSDKGSSLWCEKGHQYPVVEGVPVMLDEGRQTIWVAENSLKHAQRPEEYRAKDPYHLETMISEDMRVQFQDLLTGENGRVDPVVSLLVAATNGIAYQHLLGKLQDYPIPQLRLPPGKGEVMLDVGCNWGRWCIAAAGLGYKPIGIDPSLGAVLTAKRVTNKLGLDLRFVVGDARFLPFRSGAFDVVFSYSVLQHFSREDATQAIQEIGRTLAGKGRSLIQMPTVLGLRCLYHQARRRFREARGFEVRYWSIPALRRVFSEYVGRTRFSVDCFFGIGLQVSDLHLMPASYRAVIRASELLRESSRLVPGMYYVADSVYVESTRTAAA
jgi:SAM-dependent methyltransferase